jgi:hypothetical protein
MSRLKAAEISTKFGERWDFRVWLQADVPWLASAHSFRSLVALGDALKRRGEALGHQAAGLGSSDHVAR